MRLSYSRVSGAEWLVLSSDVYSADYLMNSGHDTYFFGLLFDDGVNEVFS